MFNPWFDASMLALESGSLAYRRLLAVSAGQCDVQAETQLMVSEKIAASMEAALTLMSGGTVETVIRRYREHVAANADRLLLTSG